MKYWKVNCTENIWPGLWRKFFQYQVAAIGWPPHKGYRLSKKSRGHGWSKARKALESLTIGDKVVIQLPKNRVGRIGEIIKLKVEDLEWEPLVRSMQEPKGEIGRRIYVRWDLANGLLDPDIVVELPKGSQLPPGIARPTICQLKPTIYKRIEDAINDSKNWVSISPHTFSLEKSISDFLGTFPHKLEDGLQPYPDLKVYKKILKVRENMFPDKKRADVLLYDSMSRAVIIECKQGNPTVKDIRQLRNYMREARKIIPEKIRGILVHGGAPKLSDEVKKYSKKRPLVEVIRYSINVHFASSF